MAVWTGYIPGVCGLPTPLRPRSLCMYAKREIASDRGARLAFLPFFTLYFPPPSSLFSFPFFFLLFLFFLSLCSSLPRNVTWSPRLASAKHPRGFGHRGDGPGFCGLGWACANVLRLRYHATTASKIEIPFPLILHGIELCGGNAGLAMGFHCNCARLQTSANFREFFMLPLPFSLLPSFPLRVLSNVVHRV